jgi:hypothetical protein
MFDVVIWSFEHDGWWAPGKSGYVNELAQAGRYDLAEAEAICERANIASLNEAVVLVPVNSARHPRYPQRPRGTGAGPHTWRD